MTRRTRKAFMTFMIWLSIDIFIGAGIMAGLTNNFTEITMTTNIVKYVLAAIIIVFNLVKLLVFLYFKWCEDTYKGIQERHPRTKKYYDVND